MTAIIRSRNAGFSLIELLVTVAIVAILATIGYSSYASQMAKSRRAEARSLIQTVLQHEERFYTANNTYTTALASMGYAGPLRTGSAAHDISLAAGPSGDIATSVAVTATALVADTQCTTLTLSSTNVESGTGAQPSVCWK